MSDKRPPDSAEIEVGDEGPVLVVEDLEREDFVRFAGATGDFNPMHYDEPAAKAAGHDSVFGPGMLTGGFAGRFLTDWFGIECVESFTVRFTAQVWPGDTVTVRGEVTDRQRTGSETVVDVAITVRNQADEEVLVGAASVRL